MATATELQDFLFETLKGVRDGSVKVDQAQAITSVATVMVNSAKVEVDFAKATGNVDSKFLQRQEYRPAQLPAKPEVPAVAVETPVIEQGKSVTANGGHVEREGGLTRHTLK